MTAIIFDLDGTLVDSAPDLHAAANTLLAEHDRPPLNLQTVTSFIGDGVGELVSRSLAAAGIVQSSNELGASIVNFTAIYMAAPTALSCLYPGVNDALAALKAKGHLLGICTNKLEAPARLIVDAMGLSFHMSALVGGDTTPMRKPDPAPLVECARLLGVGTSDFIYVGDSENDALAASCAGVPFLLFTEGYRKSPIDTLPHTHHFSDWAALPGLVSTLTE